MTHLELSIESSAAVSSAASLFTGSRWNTKAVDCVDYVAGFVAFAFRTEHAGGANMLWMRS
jgi:hypothetical protein